MVVENIFNVGDLVVTKTHPLLKDYRIKGDGNSVPPILMIKEVFIESNKKVLCDNLTGETIAERIKYICMYFNDKKSEFVEATLYQSMLETFEHLKIERISIKGDISRESLDIIADIKSYKVPKYEYGKVVRLKTKNIEIYKKRSSKKFPIKEDKVVKDKIKEIVQYVVNYTSPDFIYSGYKKNDSKSSYYPNGNAQKLTSENLVKVQWFNPFQHKFSEQYLPENFLTDQMDFLSEEIKKQ